MAAAGVAAITRAHQHHDDKVKGDMLRALRGGRGLHDNWSGAGRVLTVISGAGVPYLDLPFDSFLLLDLAGASPARSWSLSHCVGVAAAPPQQGGGAACNHDAVVAGIDGTAQPWTPLALAGDDEAEAEGAGEGDDAGGGSAVELR